MTHITSTFYWAFQETEWVRIEGDKAIFVNDGLTRVFVGFLHWIATSSRYWADPRIMGHWGYRYLRWHDIPGGGTTRPRECSLGRWTRGPDRRRPSRRSWPLSSPWTCPPPSGLGPATRQGDRCEMIRETVMIVAFCELDLKQVGVTWSNSRKGKIFSFADR